MKSLECMSFCVYVSVSLLAFLFMHDSDQLLPTIPKIQKVGHLWLQRPSSMVSNTGNSKRF